MALDSTAIERVLQFSAFVDLVQNPDNYKQLIKDLKKVSDSYNQATSDLQEAQDFVKWTKKTYDILDAKKAELDAREKQVEDVLFDFETRKQEYNQMVAKQQSVISDRETTVVLREKAVFDKASTIQPRLDELEIMERRVSEREKSVSEREQALQEKQDKLQAILG